MWSAYWYTYFFGNAIYPNLLRGVSLFLTFFMDIYYIYLHLLFLYVFITSIYISYFYLYLLVLFIFLILLYISYFIFIFHQDLISRKNLILKTYKNNIEKILSHDQITQWALFTDQFKKEA